jgi:CDP-diacylglycerol--glycerol-3-phosphate 3-phosphatidyltransferase
MNLPVILTSLRLLLSPLFFIFFFAGDWLPGWGLISLYCAWAIFFLIELSDLLDGYLARKMEIVSDLGKVLDPFADSVSRLTYFVCFAGRGIMPLWILLTLIYRDLGVAFIRLLVNKRGKTMGARLSGKIKAWVYAVAAGVGLLRLTLEQLLQNFEKSNIIVVAADFVFVFCALVAIWSLIDYLLPLTKTGH